MFEPLLPFSSSELANDMALVVFTSHDILVRTQTLQTYGASRVYATCTYTHFGTESVAEPVSETGAGIHVRPRRVDSSTELGRMLAVLGDDRVGVVRRVRVDVFDC